MDSLIIGLCCPRTGCDGIGNQVYQDSDGSDLFSRTTSWICNKCGETNFSKNVKRRDDATKAMERLSIADGSSSLWERIVALRAEFKVVKSCCSSQSWFTLWAGEEVLQAVLDYMGQTINEDEEKSLCSLALSIINEFDKAAEFCCSPADLHFLVFKGVRAKLELFLNSDPYSALQTLRNTHKELSYYYPRSHETLEGLESCMY